MKNIFPIVFVVVVGILSWVLFFKPAVPAVAPGLESMMPVQGVEGVEEMVVEEDRVRAYPMSEVAAHNTPENCWTAIRGEVYDVTAWITKHPGGEKAILKTCGIDATTLFENKHGGSEGPEAALSGFKIGTLAQ